MRQYSQPARVAQKQHGFSLLETAVAIAVLGILAAGILQLTTVFAENNAYDTTEQRIEKIHEAMTLYAAREGFLPCPADATPDGGQAGVAQSEDTNNEVCTDGRDMVGVPWRTLGIQKAKTFDGWGNRFTYVVYDGDKGLTRGAETGERRGLNMLTCNCPGPACDPENVFQDNLGDTTDWNAPGGSNWVYEADANHYSHRQGSSGTLTLTVPNVPTGIFFTVYITQGGATDGEGDRRLRGRLIEEIDGEDVLVDEDIVSYDNETFTNDEDEEEYVDPYYERDKLVTFTYKSRVSDPEIRLRADTGYDGQVSSVLIEILNGNDPRKELMDCVDDDADPTVDEDNYNEFLRGKGLTVMTEANNADSIFMDPEEGTGAAFAIISHGPNGAGAFGPGSKTADPSAPNERANVTFDGTYVDARASDVGDTTYDDILRAYTISEVAREAGLFLRE